jgi:hypothetical protein
VLYLALATSLLTVAHVRADGIWSNDGRIPSVAARALAAPDATRNIVATREGLRLADSRGGASYLLPVVALPPLWEVLWTPDSRYVAINWSDGGAVGTWDATIFRIARSGKAMPLAVSAIIRRASTSLAKCYAQEAANVGVVGWENNSGIALVVAEAPPHSSCKNMGQLRGFRIALASQKIVETLSESDLRKRWSTKLGPRLARQSK